MSLLLLSVTIIEFLIIVVCCVVLKIVRNMLKETATKSALNARRYLGYVMIAVCTVAGLDYSYSAYRYFVPADPLKFITADRSVITKDIDRDCKSALDMLPQSR